MPCSTHGDDDARAQITIYFSDREPSGPYGLIVPARRPLHVRFNELNDLEAMPPGTDYATIIRSDVPILVQHTRLDSREAQEALLSTAGYSD